MLSDNLCCAELFTLECIRGLFSSAVETMEEDHADSLLSIADIIEAVKFQSEVFIQGALEDGLRKLVSNGAQTGPRIGVEEGPPFRD